METEEETVPHWSTSALFSERVINMWNNLDKHVVSVTSMNCFKNSLQKIIIIFHHFICLETQTQYSAKKDGLWTGRTRLTTSSYGGL